uniref:RNA methyltransferase n=1 Tax=Leptocylindrus danicus TaxID=163516 RepID=A0A7S2JTI2_9STRA|mmetsp:Transcript_10935/g.16495  ORF Transcript_10935/g.16495 Transcript_10935/m.16495 type:complete len:436 (+) Transcript_10935:122-1429(+)
MEEEKAFKTAAEIRKEKKLAKKLLKRKRIEESGGVRPRPIKAAVAPDPKPTADKELNNSAAQTKKTILKENKLKKNKYANDKGKRRFGRVMESVPNTNKPRYSTLSIAVPGSVLLNCQTRELQTQLVGQIARACAIYMVDEVIVFDDQLGGDSAKSQKALSFMAKILQYMECPQYLRRNFFPMHHDLQFAGLLCPLDAPHHVRVGERSKFREGVVLGEDKCSSGSEGKSFVNIGVRQPVEIDRQLPAGIRCTVELEPSAYSKPRGIKGKVVSPAAPREHDGTYWGYTTRLAKGIGAVFEECPFPGGKYDLKIGTSERGDITVEDSKFSLPRYKHCLVVFGGVAGIEECVDADESLGLHGDDSRSLFDLWVNTCPFQGSRTIRTEEAVMISLARLRPFVAKNVESKDAAPKQRQQKIPVEVEFSDDASSEESSSEE